MKFMWYEFVWFMLGSIATLTIMQSHGMILWK